MDRQTGECRGEKRERMEERWVEGEGIYDQGLTEVKVKGRSEENRMTEGEAAAAAEGEEEGEEEEEQKQGRPSLD